LDATVFIKEQPTKSSINLIPIVTSIAVFFLFASIAIFIYVSIKLFPNGKIAKFFKRNKKIEPIPI